MSTSTFIRLKMIRVREKENIFILAIITQLMLIKNASADEAISLVDIANFKGSMLMCNKYCIANTQCQAFTIQKSAGATTRSTLNVCKLHRYKTPTDTANSVSIPNENDITMLVSRGTISQSTLIERSRLMPPVDNEAITTTEINEIVDVTTTNTQLQTESVTEDVSSTEVPVTTIETFSESSSTTTKEIPTTVTTSTTEVPITTTSTTEIPTTKTTAKLTTKITKKSTTIRTKPTTAPPNPIDAPKHSKNNPILTAMDELDDKNIFYWSDLGTGACYFTIVEKNALSKPLQDMELGKVFENWKDCVYSAFTVDGITYLSTKFGWVLYKIEKDAKGLISKATKQPGKVTNPALAKDVMGTTIIDNALLVRTENPDAAACISKSAINNPLMTAPTNQEEMRNCIIVMDFMKKDPTLLGAKSILGHDNSTLMFLNNFKLYRFKPLK